MTVMRELAPDDTAQVQEKAAKSLAEMLKGRVGLFNSADKREPQPPHTDPHEIAFGEIMREKYRKQGFNV